MKPVRIVRSRAKGWHKPENTVNVTRPSKWGNPFPIGEEGPLGRKAPDAEGAVGFFKAMLEDPELMAAAGYPRDFSELRGKNLMCWCPADQPCHADVLLDVANREEVTA